MKKVAILILIVIPFCLDLAAQNLTKTGVVNLTIRSSGTIVQDGQVKGYFQFYLVEKQDKKNYNYQLSILDENLREINSISIIRPKYFSLVEGTFNGEAFGFMFYDANTKKIELISYDRTLKLNGSITKPIQNRYALATLQGLAANGSTSAMLVPVTGKGFLYYGMRTSTAMHYQIEFLDNNMKSIWIDMVPDKTKHDVEIASEAFQDKRYVGHIVTRKSRVASKQTDSDLLVHEVQTGKQLFRAPMRTARYNLSFSDVYFDSVKNEFTVFGEYFDINDKELKDRSLGFLTLVYDAQGNIVLEKANSWENDISKVAPINEKGKFDGSNASILFHNIVRTNDGRFFVIGEQYKKAANAAGIVGNVLFVALTGNYVASNVQLNIYNMVIFEFNPDFSLKKLHIFEKYKNVLGLPAGYGSMTPRMLSYYARAVGGFDYAFTQTASDYNTFFVSFMNYSREGGQGKNVLGSIVYTPEKVFTVDKIDLARKSTDYYVYRAKEGYVMVIEYFKKEKRVETRLEKVNY